MMIVKTMVVGQVGGTEAIATMAIAAGMTVKVVAVAVDAAMEARVVAMVARVVAMVAMVAMVARAVAMVARAVAIATATIVSAARAATDMSVFYRDSSLAILRVREQIDIFSGMDIYLVP